MDCHRGASCQDSSESDADPCTHCFGSGYKGRLAIAQCVRFDGQDPVGESMADVMEQAGSADQMRRLAEQAGGIDLWQRGRMMVEQGLTDMPELYRVLGSRQV